MNASAAASKPFVDISVVIPVKDRLPELKQTLASVYLQTKLPREIIVIDDCSKVPLTPAMLSSVPEGIRLVLLRNDPNIGAARSLNRGAQEASQPYIAILDSDDCYLPDALEKMDAFWKTENVSTVGLAVGFFWCTYDLMPYRAQVVLAPGARASLLSEGNFLGGSSCMCLRRSSFIEVGGHPEIQGSYDYGLWLRLSTIGAIKTLSLPLLLYRSPSANPLPTYTKNHRRQFLAVRKLYKLQPYADRALMRTCVKRILLGELAKWGRRRLALRLWFSLVFEHKLFDATMVRFFLIIMAGARLNDKLLYGCARIRAKYLGRKLLVRFGYSTDVIKEIEGSAGNL